MAELVGRLRATSNLSTRFLQTKTALKTANVELAAAREAEQTARQAAELARREIDELKLQLRYDKSAAELQQLSETVTALRGEKEQLALKLEVSLTHFLTHCCCSLCPCDHADNSITLCFTLRI